MAKLKEKSLTVFTVWSIIWILLLGAFAHFVTFKCGTAVEANKTHLLCKEVIKYTLLYKSLRHETKFIFIHGSPGVV